MTETATVRTDADVTLIPLAELDHAPENVRQKPVPRDALDQLAASIRAHGLQTPLHVYPMDSGGFAVFAGGTRLRALHALCADSVLSLAASIPCIVRPRSEATALSLVENVHRTAMHPADAFKAYHRLHRDGLAATDIAVRFGVTDRYVEQVLQLARVHRTIFKAFRDDQISLAEMQAYALSTDTKRQKAVFDALGVHTTSYMIRRTLTEGQTRADSTLARYVGEAAYTKAGGVVVRDLFSDDVFFRDLELLQQLAAKKLDRAAARCKGWAWVETRLERPSDFASQRIHTRPVDVPDDVQIEYDQIVATVNAFAATDEWSDERREALGALRAIKQRIEKEFSNYDPSEKALAGCLVYIDYDAKTRIERGIVRRTDRAALAKLQANEAAAEAESVPEPKTASTLSAKFRADLGLIRRSIIRQCMAEQSATAILLLHFQLVDHALRGGDRWLPRCGALALKAEQPDDTTSVERAARDVRGYTNDDDDDTPADPRIEWASADSEVERFEAFAALDPAVREALVAEAVAGTLQAGNDSQTDTSLIDHLVANRLTVDAAARWRPDATNYFGRLKKTALMTLAPTFWSNAVVAGFRKDSKRELVERFEQFFHGPDDVLSDEQKQLRAEWLPSEIG